MDLILVVRRHMSGEEEPGVRRQDRLRLHRLSRETEVILEHDAAADAEALGDGRLGQAVIEEMLKQHEGIPSVHGASPRSRRQANVPTGPDGCPLLGSEPPPAGRCPECAIFAGDSEQFQAGANNRCMNGAGV